MEAAATAAELPPGLLSLVDEVELTISPHTTTTFCTFFQSIKPPAGSKRGTMLTTEHYSSRWSAIYLYAKLAEFDLEGIFRLLTKCAHKDKPSSTQNQRNY